MIKYPTPKLYEAIMKEEKNLELKADFESAIEHAHYNPYIQRYMKEAVLSDIASALGAMHDVVIEAAKPALIGREIIWVMPTTQAMVRFPLAKKGKAKKTAEGAEIWIHPEKKTTTDINANIELKAGATWSKSYIEDATWNVMDRQSAEIGRAIAELETEQVLSLYNGISASNLAGGAVQSPATSGVFAWNDLITLWNAVKNEDFNANVLVLHPDQLADLWKDDKFIHSFYFGELVDVRRGVIGETYMGMRIVVSTKCTSGTVYAIDTRVAAVMLLRRDIITEPFEDPSKDKYGIVASERSGLGTLRTKAVAKMTGA